MLRVAVFIDAGYLWKQLCQALFPDGENAGRSGINLNYSNFHAVLTQYIKENFPNIPLLRCYWYDGSLADGRPSSDHNKIALLNDFKLRLGSRITETAEGRTKQKGVDGLIIADLIGLAQNKVISHALLISGDGDMVPGVGVAQALGVRVHLLAIHSENATSPHLKMEVDFFDFWKIDTIMKFAQVKTCSADILQVAADVASNASTESTPFYLNSTKIPEDVAPSSSLTHGAPSLRIAGKTVSIEVFFETLSEDERNSIGETNIPYDIDRRLLWIGYQCKNSALTEEEKRALRNALRELAIRERH